MLCLDLFRIHQEHWDKIRHEELPAFREYREAVLKLGEAAATFQRNPVNCLTNFGFQGPPIQHPER